MRYLYALFRREYEASAIKERALWLTTVVFLLTYTFHFWNIWLYAVNIPWWDEWALLRSHALPSGLSWLWLFEQHNEHRIITTKLLVWLLYYLHGWNVASHVILNFIIFGALLCLLIIFCYRFSDRQPLWIWVAFTALLLTPLNYENHAWAFQSQFHFVVIFLILAVYLFFSENQSYFRILCGVTAAVLALYSFSAGVIGAAIISCFYCIFKFLRWRTTPDNRRTEFIQGIVCVGVLTAFTALWAVGYRKPTPDPPLTLPNSITFWNFFINEIAFGFGYDQVSFAFGLLCLILVLAPFTISNKTDSSRLTTLTRGSFVLTLCILAMLASISVGRAGSGIEYSKASRYIEFAMLLVPLSAVNWSIALESRPLLRNYFLAILWLLCATTFSITSDSFNEYAQTYARKTELRYSCYIYYKTGDISPLQALQPVQETQLDNARRLNLSFYRSLMLEFDAMHSRKHSPMSQKSQEEARRRHEYAQSLEKDGNFEDALRHLQIALRLQPKSPILHNQVGVNFSSLAFHRVAELEFRRAIELDPQYAQAYVNLGFSLLRQQRRNEALKQWRMALQIHPDYRPALSAINNFDSPDPVKE